jgi:hypothetical protein
MITVATRFRIAIPLGPSSSDDTHDRRLIEGYSSRFNALLLREFLDLCFGKLLHVDVNLGTIQHDKPFLLPRASPHCGQEALVIDEDCIMSHCKPQASSSQ